MKGVSIWQICRALSDVPLMPAKMIASKLDIESLDQSESEGYGEDSASDPSLSNSLPVVFRACSVEKISEPSAAKQVL